MISNILIIQLIILTLLVIILIALNGFIIWWARKNNILICIDSWINGTFTTTSLRCRVNTIMEKSEYKKPVKMWLLPFIVYIPKYEPKQYFFRIKDVFSKSPMTEFPVDILKYSISNESNPITGSKQEVNLKLENGFYIPYSIHHKLSEDHLISDFDVINAINTIIHVEKDNKIESNIDAFLKVALPIGLLILCTLLILFSPQIIEKIRDPALAIVEKSTQSWTQAITGIIKPG